jgi:diadenosine tetraphosphate (Ap4A) HIT family hydrolase
MSDNYSKYLIKEYKYWSIYIAQNQSYLGRCVVWCKREDALDMTDATEAEQQELFVVLNDLRIAVKKIFQPDWFNYAFLGNETRHLHGHFVPRYAVPKKFKEIIFEDKLWGHNYKTDASFKISDAVLLEIQTMIKDVI